VAEIRPFQGVHYNQSLLKDGSALICPPHDIITPQLQQELYQRSEYNFVRLELSQERPQDTATDNKYSRAAATLRQWLNQDILEVDQTPAIYLHDHYFTHQGQEYKRRGLIARIRVEEWDRMVIRPHESTMVKSRSDRLTLLTSLQANTSPILALFEDWEEQISQLLAKQEQNEPLIDLNKADDERHIIWAITEPERIERIGASMARQPLYIADGHHRYESALAYRRERQAAVPSTGDEAFNFVMMTLVAFSDPGLVILPPHRLIRGIPTKTLASLKSRLDVFFEIEELPLKMPSTWQQVDRRLGGGKNIGFALFGLDAEHISLLRLRDPAEVSQMMPYFHTEFYKMLDVSLIDHVILENLLELSSDQERLGLDYSHDRLEAVNQVLNGEFQLAFMVSPIRAEVIKAIADAGDKMPKKSTYFYPKAPAGLIVYRLVD
jgi:uncharacterized protein (DUF1015 family)